VAGGEPPFVVDWHAHFPMHVDSEGPRPKGLRSHLREVRRGQERWIDKARFACLELADLLFNRERPTDGHAVTIDTLARGNVRVALSVAYNPLDELEIEPWPAPPKDHYYPHLFDLLDRVEDAIRREGAGRARHVRDFAELRAALADGQIAMVHAVEGGFHIGHDERSIRERVAELAGRGVAYVTVAHLFWRLVATNVPALPFLPDAFYRFLFSQDDAIGLDPRGRVLVREMVRHGVLVDVTHMSKQGMRETFAWLDEVDPERTVPVIASHVACSFGKFAYNLEREFVERIAERRGTCGVIYCDHFVRDGRGCRTRTFDESFALVERQIEHLRAWGGDDVLAIGSDLDGFIKPTLAGLSSAADHAKLAARLAERYGPALAAKICHANALSVLERAWRRPPASSVSPAFSLAGRAC
jgi:microsomal dipeptidase-like Zn-dependent dipeptidase